MKGKKGFTPLEKTIRLRLGQATDEGGSKHLTEIAYGLSCKRPRSLGGAMPLFAHIGRRVRENFSNSIKKHSSLTGFTLVEILISTAIMAIAITSTLQILNYLLMMNETNDVTVLCMNELQGRIDQVRNTLYSDVVGVYNGRQFQIAELTNRGIQHRGVFIASEIEPLFITRVKVVVCWRNRTRIIGEDVNFNGVLDAGEDTNGNGELDSPIMMDAAVIDR